MKNILTIIPVLVVAILLGASIYFLPSDDSDEDLAVPKNEAVPIVAIDEKEVNYFENTKGFYAEPGQAGDYPGIVMIHEWWGLNDNIKDMARELAKDGYKVLAVDLFGKVAGTPDDAHAQVAGLNQAEALQNLKTALVYLRSQNATRIGSLGWCFGGGQSMQLALSGEDLSATVIYYGNLVTDAEKLKSIKWPVLGIFGGADQSVKVETVRDFDAALDASGVVNSVYIYPGMGHAFANPTGANYAPAETRDAWAKTLKFLSDNLKY